MVCEIFIEFDDKDFTKETAVSMAKEGLRRCQQEKCRRILIVSAFKEKPDVVVEFYNDKITVRKSINKK